jgi:large subunit ribosomal protein L13
MSKDDRNRIDHKVAPVEHTVDAKGRTIGRVATEAASILLGKKSVHFVKNKVLPVQVKIINAAKLSLPEKRLAEKAYRHYTGHVGGLREVSLPVLIEKKGISEVLKKAVDGMIPRNKLRKERMKRLTIID